MKSSDPFPPQHPTFLYKNIVVELIIILLSIVTKDKFSFEFDDNLHILVFDEGFWIFLGQHPIHTLDLETRPLAP